MIRTFALLIAALFLAGSFAPGIALADPPRKERHERKEKREDVRDERKEGRERKEKRDNVQEKRHDKRKERRE
jgi:Ni/Co efflux regulator RcnB